MRTTVLEKMPSHFWQLVEQKKIGKFFTQEVDPESEVAIIRTKTHFDKNLLDKFPRLKMIIRAGSGFDNIAVKEAVARGVQVCNTPKANAYSAYEHTLSFVMALIKSHRSSRSAILIGDWKNNLAENLELPDLRVLVVGAGRVGGRVARTLQYLGSQVRCVDPYLDADKHKDLQFCSYQQGLAWCNLLTFHCPLYDQTINYFNKQSLALLKEPIFLLNVARGEVVEEEALIKGLDHNSIRGAGLDVFASEPTKALRLQRYENIYLTPHTGAYTPGAKKRMSAESVEVWQDFVQNGKVAAPVDLRFIR